MSRPKKSRALVIVNYDFYRSMSQKLSPRPGAEKEARRLCKTLSDCNYEVQLHYDLTAKEIEDVYERGMCWALPLCSLFFCVWGVGEHSSAGNLSVELIATRFDDGS